MEREPYRLSILTEIMQLLKYPLRNIGQQQAELSIKKESYRMFL